MNSYDEKTPPGEKPPTDGKMPPDEEPPTDPEGVAMLYVAVFLLASLWFVSLAIDVGKLTAARTELQTAADAAALAGASSIDPTTGVIFPDSARVRAVRTAERNRAFEEKPTPVVIDPGADISFPAPNQVRVQVHRETATGNPVTTLFARTLGVDVMSVRADATAEAWVLNEICEGLAPFAPTQLPNGQEFSADCDSIYYLKVGSGNSEQGNFQLLDYGNNCDEGPCADTGGGADAVRCYTEYGYSCCVGIGDLFVDTEPGNKVGPLREALQWRWDQDTDPREDICYQEYTGDGSRVFTCPIVESFDLNGKKAARVTGFAAFFLRNRPTGGGQGSFAVGQFINYVAPGDHGPNPPVEGKIFGVHLVE